jgi:hypothetical protein
MKRFSLHYTLLTSRLDQLWFPLAFWLLFVIVGLLRGPQYMLDTTRAYIGVVVPLIGGIMGAYAILEDPALELRFATPVSAAQTLLERLGLTFLVQLISALGFQLFALAMQTDLSWLGDFWHVQLAWLVPAFSLMVLGCLSALLAAQPVSGALLAGLVWIVQLVARGWFAENNGRYFLVFMGPLMPDHPDLTANQASLLALSVLLIGAALLLLRRTERYL